MRCFTRFFAYPTMTFAGQYFRIWLPEIALADRAFAIGGRQRFPQLATCFSATITKGKTNYPARLAFQCDPDPDLLAFGTDK
jgi:hypothetical protein